MSAPSRLNSANQGKSTQFARVPGQFTLLTPRADCNAEQEVAVCVSENDASNAVRYQTSGGPSSSPPKRAALRRSRLTMRWSLHLPDPDDLVILVNQFHPWLKLSVVFSPPVRPI